MGPEGAVDIIFTKQIAAAEDPTAARAEYAAAVRQTIDPFIAASWAMVDDIIDPADTRRVIIDALEGAKQNGSGARGASTACHRYEEGKVTEVKAELVGNLWKIVVEVGSGGRGGRHADDPRVR